MFQPSCHCRWWGSVWWGGLAAMSDVAPRMWLHWVVAALSSCCNEEMGSRHALMFAWEWIKDTAEDKRQRSIIRPLRCSFRVLRVVGNIPEAACFHRPLSLSRPLVSSRTKERLSDFFERQKWWHPKWHQKRRHPRWHQKWRHPRWHQKRRCRSWHLMLWRQEWRWMWPPRFKRRFASVGLGEERGWSFDPRPPPSLPHLATSLTFCFVFIVLEKSVGEWRIENGELRSDIWVEDGELKPVSWGWSVGDDDLFLKNGGDGL